MMAPSDVTSGGGGGDDGRGTDSTGFGSRREGPKSPASKAETISRNSLLKKEVACGIARRSVLVIGGTQFIGRATVELLLHDRSLDVTLLNRGVSPCAFPTVDYDTGKRFRSSASETGNEGHDGRQSTPFVRLIKCDRRDPQALASVFARTPPWDIVIDFLCFDEADALPIIACASRIGMYIFISTDSVYMACDPDKFVRSNNRLLEASSEATYSRKRARKDKYGADKLKAEETLWAAGVDFVALRLPDVLGAHENTGRQQKLFMRILRGKKIGAKVCDGDGDSRQPLGLVFAHDVANAIAHAVAAPPRALSGQRLHVCCDEAPTWAEFVEATASALRSRGVSAPPLRFSEKDTHFVSVDCGALDGSALRRLLPGWRPKPLRESLESTIAWWVGTMWKQFEDAREEAGGTKDALGGDGGGGGAAGTGADDGAAAEAGGGGRCGGGGGGGGVGDGGGGDGGGGDCGDGDGADGGDGGGGGAAYGGEDGSLDASTFPDADVSVTPGATRSLAAAVRVGAGDTWHGFRFEGDAHCGTS